MTINSPFVVKEHFISPAACEKLVNELGLKYPPSSSEKQKYERIIDDSEIVQLVKPRLEEILDELQNRYSAEIIGMEPPVFQQYFEDPHTPCELHGCENSQYLRKKWVKYKDVDLVGFIWLKDFSSGVPLDPRYEVYGGKLEFPTYNFSLLPQRGTLVLYPAGPHFITAISPVLVGSLEQIKITLKLRDNGKMWFYQPQNFGGTYQDWFNTSG